MSPIAIPCGKWRDRRHVTRKAPNGMGAPESAERNRSSGNPRPRAMFSVDVDPTVYSVNLGYRF